ncbi:MAG: adenine phosphoribosyltransferase [Clostridiales bacterium]|jgi:adenine phosphoribosyltransferase|nr:adenine phosphoribosyltransferase [Clostridiales bacterium]
MNLKEAIRNFPDFPRPGILFRDITSLLKDPAHFSEAISQIEAALNDLDYDIIIAPEARGFIFAAPIAIRQGKGFVLARKKGKLPGEVVSKDYFLEYGMDSIQIHKDDIKPGQKAVIIDDLLATGGTCKGICDIAEQLGAKVLRAVFLIELEGLDGRELLETSCEVAAVLKY